MGKSFVDMLGSELMGDVTSRPPRFCFSAARRLKRSGEFERVRCDGQTVRGGLLLLGVFHSATEASFRVGFVTSRRVGGAVVRNRVRRRLREIVRRHQHSLSRGLWLVVIARPAAARATSAALEEEWLRLAQRASILRP
jgi:ribonuclease P protein component